MARVHGSGVPGPRDPGPSERRRARRSVDRRSQRHLRRAERGGYLHPRRFGRRGNLAPRALERRAALGVRSSGAPRAHGRGRHRRGGALPHALAALRRHPRPHGSGRGLPRLRRLDGRLLPHRSRPAVGRRADAHPGRGRGGPGDAPRGERPRFQGGVREAESIQRPPPVRPRLRSILARGRSARRSGRGPLELRHPHAHARRRPLQEPVLLPHGLSHLRAHGRGDGRRLRRRAREVPAPSRRLPRVRRGLARLLARSHGWPLREDGTVRAVAEEKAERVLPRAVLPLARPRRADGGGDGRARRGADDPLGIRLPALRLHLSRAWFARSSARAPDSPEHAWASIREQNAARFYNL